MVSESYVIYAGYGSRFYNDCQFVPWTAIKEQKIVV